MRLTKAQAPVPVLLLKRLVPPGWAWAFVIGALGLIFTLDRGTALTPVQHLYYIPIIVASIRFGHRGSIATAAAAILLYHLANPQVLTLRYEESDLVQMSLFVAIGITSAKLANDSRRLHRLAVTDDLTGLHNLRSFEAQLGKLVRGALQHGTGVGLLVLDIDRLKSLNDAHGHLTGAEAVRTVGHLIAEHVPENAVACRYGGDEFVIALPQCNESHARLVADSLRRAVNTYAPVLGGTPFPAGTLSISVGIACRAFEPRTSPRDLAGLEAEGERLFSAADAALYAAKSGGRNRVSVAPSDVGAHSSAS